MTKKILLALGLSVLVLQNLAAAPYNMDAPIESYTWGEDFMTVWRSRGEGEMAHKISDDTILFVQEDDSALIFRFWHNQLTGISKSYLTSKMTPEEKSAIYARHLDEFTTRWGKPVLEQPCLASPLTCSEAVWNPVADTRVTLYQNTTEADRPFIGYSYTSREMHPKYEQEIREYGARHELSPVLRAFKEKPEYAEKAFKGKRIQVEARIVSVSPLRLDQKGKEIICTLKNSKDARSLQAGQIITVSGVIAGVKDDSLFLSDTIFVDDHRMAIHRKGKRPQGFFTVETFSQQLETASNKAEKGFFIREYLSPVRLEGQRAIVDFIGKDFPPGLSFSLEPLYKDQSSDTIAFNMHIDEDDKKVNGYFMLAVVGIMINATQPAASMNDVWTQIERLMNEVSEKGSGKGKVVIDGWTYEVGALDDRNIIFSATAPRRRR